MPTGYTAGIQDGTITTFEDYATNCIRAFGAAIHLKDELMGTKFTEKTPYESDYHTKKIIEAKADLEKLKTKTDEQIFDDTKKLLEDELQNLKDRIVEHANERKIFDSFLEQAINWTPPTDEHVNYKRFLIEQLKSTIDYDYDDSYSIENIIKIERELTEIDVVEIRKDEESRLKEYIQSREKGLVEEIENCDKDNKWVEQIMDTFDKK